MTSLMIFIIKSKNLKQKKLINDVQLTAKLEVKYLQRHAPWSLCWR